MSKTILITGGAASGKSRWAVSYLAACDYVLYLRTADEVDKDTLGRIEYRNKHNFVEWDIKTGITSTPVETITDHKFVIFDNRPYVSRPFDNDGRTQKRHRKTNHLRHFGYVRSDNGHRRNNDNHYTRNRLLRYTE